MNEIELIKSQLTEINNKRIKYETLKEQAKKHCEEIQKKYNITSLQQLQQLKQQQEQVLQTQIQQAQQYIQEANAVLNSYSEIIQ